MKRKKSLQVHHFNLGTINGGVDKVVAELVEGFENEEVVLFEVGTWADRQLTQRKFAGVNIYRLRLVTLFNEKLYVKRIIRFLEVLRTVFILKRIIRKEKIDVVHLHTLQDYHFYFVILARFFRCNYIVTLHRAETLEYPKRSVNQQKRWAKVLKYASKVTAVSAELASIAYKNLPLKTTPLVTYNGIIDPKQVKSKLASPPRPQPGEKFALCVGTLKPYKGHDIAIKAWEWLKSHQCNVRLYIAGEGDFRKELQALIEEYGCQDSITLLGNIAHDDALVLIEDSELFIMPSRNEGLGLALIEAMAIGTPVIASDIDVFQEIVKDLESGYLFTAGDHLSLAKCVLTSLSNMEQTTSHVLQARKSFEIKFTRDAMIDRYRDLFNAL